MILLNEQDTISAFFLCHKNTKATSVVIDKFFNVFPDGEIFLYSDNGSDYSGLTKIYKNLIYQYNSYQINPFAMNSQRSKYWASLLYQTTHQAKNKYVMHLEDDVWINRKFEINNKNDLVSGFLKARFQPKIFNRLKTYKSLKNMRIVYNGAGGALFNKSIIQKQKLSDIHAMIDFYCGIRPLWSDQLPSLMIYLGGGTLGRDPYHGRDKNKPVVHSVDCKKYYGLQLNSEEQKILNNKLDTFDRTFT